MYVVVLVEQNDAGIKFLELVLEGFYNPSSWPR